MREAAQPHSHEGQRLNDCAAHLPLLGRRPGGGSSGAGLVLDVVARRLQRSVAHAAQVVGPAPEARLPVELADSHCERLLQLATLSSALGLVKQFTAYKAAQRNKRVLSASPRRSSLRSVLRAGARRLRTARARRCLPAWPAATRTTPMPTQHAFAAAARHRTSAAKACWRESQRRPPACVARRVAGTGCNIRKRPCLAM